MKQMKKENETMRQMLTFIDGNMLAGCLFSQLCPTGGCCSSKYVITTITVFSPPRSFLTGKSKWCVNNNYWRLHLLETQ